MQRQQEQLYGKCFFEIKIIAPPYNAKKTDIENPVKYMLQQAVAGYSVQGLIPE
jgi:hypothetical protein